MGRTRVRREKTTVTVEAIADHSLWIWHELFGMPGCLNDINVVEASMLLNKIAQGYFPPSCEFLVAVIRRKKPH